MSAPDPHPLELDGPTLRQLGLQVLDKLSAWVDATPERPVLRSDGSWKAARRMAEPVPETPTSFRRLLSRLMSEVMPVGLDPSSPGYLAFIPGGGLPHSALADLITGVVNRYTGIWKPAPALVQLEITVLRWLCEWVGFDGPDAGGLLTSGGSIANLCAVVAAREYAKTDDLRLLTCYTTAQTHSSVVKSVRTAGLRPEQVQVVPHDARFRISLPELEAAIARDLAAGRRPFLIVANGGCTPVGAVDPLEELARLRDEHGIWLHVDGAYGGAFVLTERGRRVLNGIALADSVTLDPHKGLFLPYGTGAILVRKRAHLREAFTVKASYLPDPDTHPDHWDFADLGPELSRPARGLRIWLPLKMHGAEAFREQLNEKLDLAAVACERIAALPHVRIVARPDLSLFAFRVEPPGRDGDRSTRAVLSAVGRRRRVLITGARVREAGSEHEVFVGRVCVLSFRTHAERIDALIEDLKVAITEVTGGS